jgi:hypothetical protein
MRNIRFFLFILSILVGAGAGIAYGWIINPPPYANLSPDTLRYDYKADYVLMVAEIYHKDNNLPQALRRLSSLGDLPPARIVNQALLSARDLQYDPADLDTMGKLAQALQGSLPSSTEVAPTLEITPSLGVPRGTP